MECSEGGKPVTGSNSSTPSKSEGEALAPDPAPEDIVPHHEEPRGDISSDASVKPLPERVTFMYQRSPDGPEGHSPAFTKSTRHAAAIYEAVKRQSHQCEQRALKKAISDLKSDQESGHVRRCACCTVRGSFSIEHGIEHRTPESAGTSEPSTSGR